MLPLCSIGVRSRVYSHHGDARVPIASNILLYQLIRQEEMDRLASVILSEAKNLMRWVPRSFADAQDDKRVLSVLVNLVGLLNESVGVNAKQRLLL